MKVRVQFFSRLRDLAGGSTLDVEVPGTPTVNDLLQTVYARAPNLRAQDRNILIGAGLEFVDRNYLLKPGEEISLMPPVQGG